MSTLVVTSPHSLCYHQVNGRQCDLLAHLAASRLLLQLDRDGTVQYFPGTQPRFEIDLNRSGSRGTEYRATLSQSLDNYHPQLLIDIHSFPSGEFEGVDIAVVDNQPGTWYGRSLFQTLSKLLPKSKVGYFEGSEINDIVIEARGKGIPAILVEYREDLNIDQIDSITRVMTKWINSKLPVASD